jgi:putative ABC transport system permease protein
MDALLQDVRYGIRLLFKHRGVSLVAVAALALGIGANTAIFSVVNALILRPLPYPNAERLAFLHEWSKQIDNMSVAYPNFLDWRAQNTSFDYLAASNFQAYNMTGEGEPERLVGANVSADLFRVLGVQPALGRAFTAEDDRPGAERVAVIGHSLWQQRFGGDPGLIGRALTLNGQSYTVVGVLPQGMRPYPQFGAQKTQLWTPIGLLADNYSNRENHPGIYVAGLLKPGATVEQAQADMAAIARRLSEQYPNSNRNLEVRVQSLHERVVGDTRTPLFVLLGAVGFVLLIACANVANLLLARAAARAREIAVRAALGAGRVRLIRQLLAESVVLALAGGILGVLLAYWGITLLLAAAPANVPRLEEVRIDTTVLGFTALLALLTGVFFGLVPALQASTPDLHDTLKDSIRGTTGGRSRLRHILVVTEVSLALVLLIGAGLLIRSFWHLSNASPGFSADNVLTVQLVLPASQYPDASAQRGFYNRLMPRLASLPGVTGADMIVPLPLGGGGWQTGFWIEGRPAPDLGEYPSTDIARVSPSYFRTMGIPLLRGRAFTEQDHENAPLVAIVDERLAKDYFPGEDPVGKRLQFGPLNSPVFVEIVGVVGHVKNYGVEADSRVETYFPYLQSPVPPITLMLRTSGDPLSIASGVRNEVLAVDANLPVFNIRTMASLVNDSVASRRLTAILLTVFAAVALVLAAVGIYGVMSYAVAQRTHEIGIRMALGAPQGSVLRLVVRQGMTLAGIGLAIGLAAAFGVTRWMETMLYNVSATDPGIYAGIAALIALIALAASYVPARRAARVDPLVALRYE